MRNNHVSDMLRRYQAFRKARGLAADPPPTSASVEVFALGR
jgi:hypothetical protein